MGLKSSWLQQKHSIENSPVEVAKGNKLLYCYFMRNQYEYCKSVRLFVGLIIITIHFLGAVTLLMIVRIILQKSA